MNCHSLYSIICIKIDKLGGENMNKDIEALLEDYFEVAGNTTAKLFAVTDSG